MSEFLTGARTPNVQYVYVFNVEILIYVTKYLLGRFACAGKTEREEGTDIRSCAQFSWIVHGATVGGTFHLHRSSVSFEIKN
jgi:hypothetical protein